MQDFGCSLVIYVESLQKDQFDSYIFSLIGSSNPEIPIFIQEPACRPIGKKIVLMG